MRRGPQLDATYLVYWRAGASQPSHPTGTIFLYIYLSVYMYFPILRFYGTLLLQFHVHRVSRMRKYISLRSSVLQLTGLCVVGRRLALRRLYSCSQLCVLLACIYINNLYCKLQSSSFLAQLLHHFLPYISWIAPTRQQC